MAERRVSSRSKSFLQGRVYFNNRRSSIDCLVRDYSEIGARLKLSEAVTVPEAIEFYVPNKEVMHRARVEWRTGNEMGISFGEAARSPAVVPEPTPGDLAARMQALETEVATLKRLLNDLRSGLRKRYGDVA